MNYFDRAKQLAGELIGIRRDIHRHPEVGLNTEGTASYIEARLREMGYEPYRVGETGVCATVGVPVKTIMLRADIDALPMGEESGLPFASENEGAAHCCGHDLHATMLLGAAKLLKENESELKGTVKLMFQPGEEPLEGARAMIEDGVLENPHVDAAMAIHVHSLIPNGAIVVFRGPTAASEDIFTITVHGKGCHGSTPEEGVDPIAVACHIHTMLQQLQARELGSSKVGVLTVGSFTAGKAPNVIPGTAVMSGTIRTFDTEVQEMLKRRLVEISEGVAASLRATAEVTFAPHYTIPLVSDEVMSSEVNDALLKIFSGKQVRYVANPFAGSEDFAFVAERVPSTYVVLGASVGPDAIYGQHHPKVQFNEGCLPVGAAVHAQAATEWLARNAE